MSISAQDASAPAGLPELAGVPWRRRADAGSMRRRDRLWTLTSLAHAVPLCVCALGLVISVPVLAPISLVLLLHAWAIPELYANRGAKVVREPRHGPGAAPAAERIALGFLGDLVGHEPRALHQRTGLMLERGELGVWLLAPAGALLVRPGGRRVHCYCVRSTDPALPRGDRIAHLLLALRTDELGFVTVANLAFSGARWRVRRRLPAGSRSALEAAAALARQG